MVDRKLSPAQLNKIPANIIPEEDDKVDLGSSSKEFKDIYIDGTANIDVLVAGASTLGATTPSSITKIIVTTLTKTSAYTALVTDNVIFVNASTAFTITLPDASLCTGLILRFVKVDSGTDVLTLDGSGTQKVDASVTYVAVDAQYDSVTIISNGTAWFILNTKLA